MEKTRVVESPQEIKIHGNFTRVFIEGNDLYQTLVFEKKSAHPSIENRERKLSDKRYVIVPIKDNDSVVHFVKIPVFKLKKHPKANKIGTVNCEGLTSYGIPLKGELDTWSAKKAEIMLDDERYMLTDRKKDADTVSKESQRSRESKRGTVKKKKSCLFRKKKSQERSKGESKKEVDKTSKEQLKKEESEKEIYNYNATPKVSENKNPNPPPTPQPPPEDQSDMPHRFRLLSHLVTTKNRSNPKPKKTFSLKKRK